MNYDVHITYYGRGKKSIGSGVIVIDDPEADVAAYEAIKKAMNSSPDGCVSVAVRGVYPSPVQFVSDRPGPRAEDVLEVREPKKRGRPRG